MRKLEQIGLSQLHLMLFGKTVRNINNLERGKVISVNESAVQVNVSGKGKIWYIKNIEL